MFINTIIVALRRLARDRLYSVINIAGLALGFAAVTLIGLYILFELSYDQWIVDHDQIYKIEFIETEPGHKPLTSAMTPGPLAAAMVKDYADIDYATRMKQAAFTLQQNATQFNETITFVDSSFFDVFDIDMAMGDRESVTVNASAIAISKRMALKYFGTENPLGKILSLNGRIDQKVTAVFDNLPSNSHFDLDFIVMLDERRYGENFISKRWGSDSVHTYIKLKKGGSASAIEQDGRAFATRNITLTWTKLPPADLISYTLMPIRDIHLYSKMDNHEKPISDIKTVVTFAIVAGLILVLAGINFTNLSIAQAMRRAREIGIRKVLGARRGQIIKQFLSEAMFTTFIGLVIGLSVAEVLLPYYSNFLDKDLSFFALSDPLTIMGILVILLLTGLGGGIYPAFVLSGFSPSDILRSSKSSYCGTPWFRNALVVLQFSVSIALIAATTIVYNQVEFVKSADLGFSTEGKVSIPVWQKSIRPKAQALKDQFRRIAGVKSVAVSTTALPRTDGALGVFVPPHAGRQDARSISVIRTDADFFNLLGQAPISGRLFSNERIADFKSENISQSGAYTRSAILNEMAVKSLGFESAAAAVGQQIITPSDAGDTYITIVGVVKDVHFESLYKEIEAIVFLASDRPLYYMLVDIDPALRSAVVANMGAVWQSLVPEVTMEMTYLDQAYANIYRDANRQATLFAAFAALAIVVACLGLYGLAAHMAERRTKEIGIRKVLGAKVGHIVVMLTWQFTKLVVVAAPIGVLASSMMMGGWLDGFAYRISLIGNAWIFALAASVAFIIAWATVAGHAYKVAQENPIKALSTE